MAQTLTGTTRPPTGSRDGGAWQRHGKHDGIVHRGARALMLGALLATSLPADADILSFRDHAYPVGANPKGLTAGDCDGDGTIDLLSANQNANDLTMLRNDGAGALEFGRASAVATQPTGAVCADLTGDGLVDLAAVSRDGGVLTIYRRQESGGFTPLGSLPAGLQPTDLVAGDLNGDGKTDLVAVGSRSDDITVALGTASTALPPFVSMRVAMEEPLAAAIADFDRDGHQDIAVTGGYAPYVLFLFGSNIGLAPRPAGAPGPFAGTRQPAASQSVASADLNLDGNPDLALLSLEGVVSLYLGTGTGQFTFLDAFAMRAGAEAITLTDLNADGLADLAAAYSDTNCVEVYLATGPAQFPLPIPVPAGVSFSETGPAATRQIQLDPSDPASTQVQLVTVDEAARTVAVVTQDQLDELSITPLVTLPDPPETLLLADLTGDGILDAVVGSNVRRGVPIQILRGTSAGSYEPFVREGAATCGNGVLEGPELCDDGNLKSRDGCSKRCEPELKGPLAFLGAADVDGDLLSDLVVVDKAGRLVVLLSDGQGRFREVQLLAKVRRKTPAALADFTGDGAVDVVILPKSRRDGALLLLANDGSGAFVPAVLAPDLRFTGPLLAADFDGDGLMDVAVGVRGGWTVVFNDGAGPNRVGAVMPAARGLSSFAAADFDENGWIDLLTLGRTRREATASLYRGTSTGAFTPGETLALDGLSRLHVVDLDQDQHQDIVSCGGAQTPLCRAFYGDGAGAFGNVALPDDGSIGREVWGAAAEDLDHDGSVDLVGISRRDNRAIVLFRSPDRAARQELTLETGVKPADMTLVDLDGNAIDDIVVANEDSEDLSIFMNFGQRQLPALAPVRLPAGGAGTPALAAGDIDGDGRADIVVSQAGSSTVTIYLNIGSVLVVLATYEVGAEPRDVALGNLNGDGIPDVVTANRTANSVTVLLSQPGGGYLRADHDSAGLRPSSVVVTDLDGDALDDLAVTNEKVVSTSRVGSVATFLNDGTATFGAPTAVHVRGRETPRGICAGDFDGDGRRDVAVASLDSDDIMILFGNAAGGWRRDERTFPVGQEVVSVRCHDADGDGLTDVAYGRRKAGDVGAILTAE